MKLLIISNFAQDDFCEELKHASFFRIIGEFFSSDIELLALFNARQSTAPRWSGSSLNSVQLLHSPPWPIIEVDEQALSRLSFDYIFTLCHPGEGLVLPVLARALEKSSPIINLDVGYSATHPILSRWSREIIRASHLTNLTTVGACTEYLEKGHEQIFVHGVPLQYLVPPPQAVKDAVTVILAPRYYPNHPQLNDTIAQKLQTFLGKRRIGPLKMPPWDFKFFWEMPLCREYYNYENLEKVPSIDPWSTEGFYPQIILEQLAQAVLIICWGSRTPLIFAAQSISQTIVAELNDFVYDPYFMALVNDLEISPKDPYNLILSQWAFHKAPPALPGFEDRKNQLLQRLRSL